MKIPMFFEYLHDIFEDNSLFGFSKIDAELATKTGCKCSLVTLLPYPDLRYMYNAVEYFDMLEKLRAEHAEKLNKVKQFLDGNTIKYATPPASPKDDGNHKAEVSHNAERSKLLKRNKTISFGGKTITLFVSNFAHL